MNLSIYCSVAEACRMAGVSDGYMRRLLRDKKVAGEKVGNTYLVLRSSLKKFERQPGMGRPRKADASAAARPRRRKRPSKPAK
jgi:excisionase family DNA binding protein